jgi:hypothetical protein
MITVSGVSMHVAADILDVRNGFGTSGGRPCLARTSLAALLMLSFPGLNQSGAGLSLEKHGARWKYSTPASLVHAGHLAEADCPACAELDPDAPAAVAFAYAVVGRIPTLKGFVAFDMVVVMA